MASLENVAVKDSYTSLLKLSGNTDTLVAGASGDAIQVVDGNGDASPLYLNTDRLGIGGQPTTELHILSSTGDRPVLTIENTNADNSPPSIHLYKNSSGVANNDQMGDISWFANDDGGTKTRSAMIRAIQTDVSASSDDSKLGIFTQKAGVETETMTISSGNVGIGNSALETWKTDMSVLQLGGDASFAAKTTAAGGNDFFISRNAYWDSTNNRWEYMSTNGDDEAERLVMANGTYFFDLTGTAGADDAAITFTTALKLDQNSRISLSNNDTSGTGGGDSSSGNTIFGYLAGNALVGSSNTGYQSVYIGHRAGEAVTTGDNNLIIGNQTGKTLTTSGANVLLGTHAGGGIPASQTTTDGTVAIGYFAGNAIEDVANTAIGYYSLSACTTGKRNTAVGYQSLSSAMNVGDSNTGVGYRSLYAVDPENPDEGANSALGSLSGSTITTGEGNTCIGYASGATGTNDLTMGDNNTLIGQYSIVSAAGASNQTVIGSETVGQGNNSVTLGNANVTDVYMNQDSGAKVHANQHQLDITSGFTHGITAQLPTQSYFTIKNAGSDGGAQMIGASDAAGVSPFQLVGIIGVTDPTDTTPAFQFDGAKSNGSTSVAALAAAETLFEVKNWGTSRFKIVGDGTFAGLGTADISDERLKENIKNIDNGLDTINKLQGRTFTWKEEADMSSGTKYGLIAQELEKVLPDLVYDKNGIRQMEDGTHYKSITMSGIIPVLIEAVKELSLKVTELENKLK